MWPAVLAPHGFLSPEILPLTRKKLDSSRLDHHSAATQFGPRLHGASDWNHKYVPDSQDRELLFRPAIYSFLLEPFVMENRGTYSHQSKGAHDQHANGHYLR